MAMLLWYYMAKLEEIEGAYQEKDENKRKNLLSDADYGRARIHRQILKLMGLADGRKSEWVKDILSNCDKWTGGYKLTYNYEEWKGGHTFPNFAYVLLKEQIDPGTYIPERKEES
jgi:prenyltransferase beta subunit